MRIRIKYILYGISLFFVLAISIQAKQGKYAVCSEKKMWLMNEAQAVVLGKCGGKTWIAKLNLESTVGQSKLSKDEQKALNLIQKISKEQFKPISLKSTNLEKIIASNQTNIEIRIDLNKLAQYTKEFLTPMMEFFITNGLVDESDWQYLEAQRFSIKLQSANPTIAEMIEEVRKNNPNKDSVKRNGNFYTLEYHKTGERLEDKKFYSKEFWNSWRTLDETKTAIDYNLKSGDVFVLSVDIKRRKEFEEQQK